MTDEDKTRLDKIFISLRGAPYIIIARAICDASMSNDYSHATSKNSLWWMVDSGHFGDIDINQFKCALEKRMDAELERISALYKKVRTSIDEL